MMSVRQIPSYYLAKFEGAKLSCAGRAVSKIEVVTRPEDRGRESLRVVLIGPSGIVREEAGNHLVPDERNPLLVAGTPAVVSLSHDASLKPVVDLLEAGTRRVLASAPLEEETLLDVVAEAA